MAQPPQYAPPPPTAGGGMQYSTTGGGPVRARPAFRSPRCAPLPPFSHAPLFAPPQVPVFPAGPPPPAYAGQPVQAAVAAPPPGYAAPPAAGAPPPAYAAPPGAGPPPGYGARAKPFSLSRNLARAVVPVHEMPVGLTAPCAPASPPGAPAGGPPGKPDMGSPPAPPISKLADTPCGHRLPRFPRGRRHPLPAPAPPLSTAHLHREPLLGSVTPC